MQHEINFGQQEINMSQQGVNERMLNVVIDLSHRLADAEMRIGRLERAMQYQREIEMKDH